MDEKTIKMAKEQLMQLVSLAEIAKEYKINKSKLKYYYDLGLLKESTRASNVLLFDKNQILDDLAVINNLQEQGNKITEIVKLKKEIDENKQTKLR